MKNWSFGVLRGLAALSLCLAVTLARAQDNEVPDADPPERAARLSLIQGDVSLQPAGEEEWTNAVLNRPLTTGDKLWTDQGARAEIQLGSAAIRLGSGTGFSFLNLDDNTLQMRVTAGVLNVSVRALEGSDQIEIDTPNVALSVLRPGSYRVEVNDAGDTSIVKVSEGELEANGAELNVIVHAQQAVTFTGTERLDSRFASLGSPDEFDAWSLERERRDDAAATSRTAEYVSPDVTGYEDLDANGSWSSEAEYGYVWTPRVVAVDWSPYRYGRWAWVGPWGWTWIDDAPWGYAPFHYGRWAHVRNRWCWVPGPRHVRAVYAPALVGWSSRGNGVAWFPLGPREVYVPARRFSHRYFERVNDSNTIIVDRGRLRSAYENRDRHEAYRNRAVKGAVTAVLRDRFTSGQRVSGHQIRVDERENIQATARAPQIAPVRESRLAARDDSRRNVRVPPQALAGRQVTVKRAPPPSNARYARNAADVTQTESRREQADRPNRPRERANGNERDASTRADAIRNAQAAETRRAAGERTSPDVQGVDNEQTQRVRQRNDRPRRNDRPQSANQPQIEGGARQAQPTQSDRRVPMERQQQTDQQQHRQQNYQERQQRDIQQAVRRSEAQQREQAERRQPARQQETRQPEVRQPEARQPEVRQREQPGPQRPANDNPQPRQNRGHDRPGRQR